VVKTDKFPSVLRREFGPRRAIIPYDQLFDTEIGEHLNALFALSPCAAAHIVFEVKVSHHFDVLQLAFVHSFSPVRRLNRRGVVNESFIQ
jgi:hypothetical protein